MLLFILSIDTSLIVGDEKFRNLVCWHYCIVFWSIAVPSYNVSKSVSFAEMSGHPLDDVFVSVRMAIVSLDGFSSLVVSSLDVPSLSRVAFCSL